MPIIPNVGRKSRKLRAAIIAIYTILILGSITMLYPFMLMLSGSISSPFDFDDFSLAPRYLRDEESLLKKYLFDKYGQLYLNDLSISYGKEDVWINWDDVKNSENFTERIYGDIAADYEIKKDKYKTIASDWGEFTKSLDISTLRPYFNVDTDYRIYLEEKYKAVYASKNPEEYSHASERAKKNEALACLNNRYGRAYRTFSEIMPLQSFFYEQGWFPYQRADFQDWTSFKASRPAQFIDVVAGKRMWVRYLAKQFVTVTEFVKTTGIGIERFSELPVPVTDKNSRLYKTWTEFLKKKYPLRMVSLSAEAKLLWLNFLEERFGDVSKYNSLMDKNIKSLQEVSFSSRAPQDIEKRMIWIDFVVKKVPVRQWNLHLPEDMYPRFLANKYKDILGLNRAYAAKYNAFDEIELPWKIVDYYEFKTNKNHLRKDYVIRNYRDVFAFLITKSRAALNTLILVVLAVGSALTVNPLAAYVLSRCNQKTATKILIFFLATMAFPAEVAMIPGFLLLKQLGLLNTFGALVLPGLANGYSIFLLKGFFDSIPRELYEAAAIDGATEAQTFRLVTFPMSKPILAVIALGAFNMAYGGFMWAFLTCQNPKMWTMMVWLYDFQSRYSAKPGLVMAALTLASIPTLLVFLFCQKIIMRGIIIPTMK